MTATDVAASPAVAQEATRIFLRLVRPRPLADPYPWYRRLRELAPVHTVRLPGLDTALVTASHAETALLLRHRSFGPLSPAHLDVLSPGWRHQPFTACLYRAMAFRHGHDHRASRGLAAADFTVRATLAHRAMLTALADELLDALERGSPEIDLVQELALPFSALAIGRVMGVPDPTALELARLFRTAGTIFEPLATAAQRAAQHTAGEQMLALVTDLLSARRRTPRNDLLTRLAHHSFPSTRPQGSPGSPRIPAARDPRASHDARGPRDARDTHGSQNAHATWDSRNAQDSYGTWDSRNAQDSHGARDSRDAHGAPGSDGADGTCGADAPRYPHTPWETGAPEEGAELLAEPVPLEDEALNAVMMLFSAGSDSPVSAVGMGAHLFMEHPGQASLLRADPALARAAAEEVLRYEPPVQLAVRSAYQDTDLAGIPVPHGGVVFGFLASANRDPSSFPDPDHFDITRTPGPTLSFGAGAHYCLGAPLARLQAELLFPRLLSRFPDMRPAGPLHYRTPGTMLRGPDTLPVVLR